VFNIVYSEKVKNDFKSISSFIAEDNPIYAIKTIASIIKTIDMLIDFPYIWKIIDGDLRELI